MELFLQLYYSWIYFTHLYKITAVLAKYTHLPAFLNTPVLENF